jgi:hypothetical protein
MATAENTGQEIGNIILAHTKFSSFPVYSTFSNFKVREKILGQLLLFYLETRVK